MRAMMIAAAPVLKARQRGLEFKGFVTSGDFITGNTLAVAAGLTVGTAIQSSAGWFEFTRDGKRLMLARRPFRRSVSWNELNSRNLIYGNKTVDIAGKAYKVRLLTGSISDPSNGAGGEWDELMYGLCASRPATYKGPIFGNYTASDLIIGTNASSDFHSTLCQETTGNNTANCVRRGRDNVQYYSGLSKTDNGTTVYWRPILEEV